MIHLGQSRHIKNNHIKSDIAVTILSMNCKKTFSSFDNSFLFSAVQYMRKKLHIAIWKSFYFHKNNKSILCSNYINFSFICPKISLNNFISVQNKIFCRTGFAGISYFFFLSFLFKSVVFSELSKSHGSFFMILILIFEIIFFAFLPSLKHYNLPD